MYSPPPRPEEGVRSSGAVVLSFCKLKSWMPRPELRSSARIVHILNSELAVFSTPKIIAFSFQNSFCSYIDLFICLFIHCVLSVCIMAYVWRLDDNLWELMLSWVLGLNLGCWMWRLALLPTEISCGP